MMEYWRQCALWLINCKVLPANHRVTWESAQVFDLAQTLRDGVLLCHLLNNLRPQTINLKEINLRPQMSQVKKEGEKSKGSERAPRSSGGGRALSTELRWRNVTFFVRLSYSLVSLRPTRVSRSE